MKISVVIPTYQREALLLKCIDAVCNQDFPTHEFEIIIISDGPDETSRNAVFQRNLDKSPTIRFYSLVKKSGPAAARNYGWRSANSRFIAFTDDDCLPDPKWLLCLWNGFLRSSSRLAAFSGRTIVPLPKTPTDYERNIANLEKAEFITANCACTKAALEKVGGFDEQFKMAWREDSDLQFKFIENEIPIIPVKNAIVVHPVRKAQWGVSIKEERKGVFNALLFKKFPTLYRKKIQSSPPWHYYLILFFLLQACVAVLLQKSTLTLFSIVCWFVVTIWFTLKRLSNTSHSLKHVVEMFVTSAVIPILSVYYRIYGAVRFKSPLFP